MSRVIAIFGCGLTISLLSAAPALAAAGAQGDVVDEAATAPSEESNSVRDQTGGIAEIVVTAERRETSMQRTPIAISVLDGDGMQQRQISSALDAAADLPSVSIGHSTGQAQLAIRGVGFATLNPGDEGRVAYYIDGVYLARPSAQLGTFFDVDRVEVLRGPQGTLYGRNATGGAFNVFSRKPTRELDGYVDVTVGNYGLVSTASAISGPLSDTLSARVAVQAVRRDGYGRNEFLDQEINNARTVSTRVSLLWEPSENFDLNLSGHYHQERDRNYALLLFGPGIEGTPSVPGTINFSQNINSYFSNYNRRHSYGFQGSGTYRLSDTIDFKSIVAYEHNRFDIVNGEGGPRPLVRSRQNETSDQFSAEFQLNGSSDSLNWTVGTYYFYEKLSPANRAMVLGSALGGPDYMTQGFSLSANLQTEAFAGFGQVNYKVTDRLSVTIGARYSHEKKKDRNDMLGIDLETPFPAPGAPYGEIPLPPVAPFPLNQDASFNSFTPKVGIEYRITPDVFAYAVYSKGFKSGGFNFATVQQAFSPENIENYESGLKSTFLDDKLRINLSGFIYKYSDIQTQIVNNDPPGVFVQNSGRARIKGIEIEVTAKPIREIQLDANYGFLDAKFLGFQTADPARPELGVLEIGGNRVPQAPRYTLNLGAQYTIETAAGSFSLRGEYRRQGRTFFTIFNTPTAAQAPYGIGNAFINFESDDGHWTASAFLRNIGNKLAATSMFVQSSISGGGLSGSAIAPRTFGASIGYKF